MADTVILVDSPIWADITLRKAGKFLELELEHIPDGLVENLLKTRLTKREAIMLRDQLSQHINRME